MTHSANMNQRAIAAHILHQVCYQKHSLSMALQDALKGVPADQQALIKELCFGTCRWYYRLHAIADTLLHTPLKSKDLDMYCLLLLGIYQIYYLNIPDYASVDETVN